MFTSTIQKRWRPAIRRPGGLLLLVATCALSIGCVQVQAGDGGFVMGGSIVVEEGEVAREDLVAVGGSITVNGEARRDVVVVGGRLTINGVAHRSVSCVAGTLVLGPGARVGGDVVVVGGELRRDPTARVDGELVTVGFGGPPLFGGDFFSPWLGGRWGFPFLGWFWDVFWLGVWVLLTILTLALVGDRVSSASHAIRREPLKQWFIGFVGAFALALLGLLLAILCFVIIGIPFFVAWVFAAIVAYIFGLVAIFHGAGERIMRAFGRPDASQLAIGVVGCIVIYAVCTFVPILGSFTWFFLLVPLGFGSVFTTRFGSGRTWTRQAVPPAAPPPRTPPPPAPDASSGPAAASMEFDEPSPSDEGYSTSAYEEPEETSEDGESSDEE